jgi:hypothetical protein
MTMTSGRQVPITKEQQMGMMEYGNSLSLSQLPAVDCADELRTVTC